MIASRTSEDARVSKLVVSLSWALYAATAYRTPYFEAYDVLASYSGWM